MGHSCSTDCLLSATIESYRKNGFIQNAITLYFNKMDDIESNHNATASIEVWKESAFQCLLALIELQDIDKAYNFFIHMKKEEHTTQSLLSIARCLDNESRWSDIANIWRIAVDIDCLSEEIGLIALKAISRSTQFDFEEEHTMKTSLFRIITRQMGNLTNEEPLEWAKSHYWKLKKELLPKDYVRLLRWKKGEIKQNEMKIAFVDFMHSLENDEPMDENVLISIVRKAGYQQRHVRCRGNPIPEKKDYDEKSIQLQERQEGIDIILKVLHYAQKTQLGYDPYFTLQVAKGLRALKANELVIELLRNLVQQKNVEIRPMTYLQAVFAATSLNDKEAKDEILDCMKNAGLTFDIDKEMLRMRYFTAPPSDEEHNPLV